MFEQMFDLLTKLMSVLGQLVGWLSPPLKVEVNRFQYRETRNIPGDGLVVPDLHPQSYYAELGITNRTHYVVYTKSVTLTINKDQAHRRAATKQKIRLGADVYKEMTVFFPLGEKDKPIQAGRFQIVVVPAVGRAARVRGCFPLDNSG